MRCSTFGQQRGASVTSIVLFIIALGLLAKLAIGIIPAYVGDYQFTKLVAQELKEANEAKQTDKQFLNSLSQQLSINANYDSKPEEMLIFTNKTPGALAVKSQYEVESNFYGGTYIVNRFEKEITAKDTK
ncbi:DUF4845 domain-containing protein [Moraxella sp. VT-16-12]|uniref:DUF4845 domain-containing protein n=1 Tax=Moraxella sp. VT-16-12 TaxID=2014877 RepID=UPI000B7E7465|nr:DUF4845 domain-containing protein [Moraxella sp. VT-16-12]TWV82399.1 DUF4845 domain-containing protein [Moraxella sp. VT-16-12]